ncbi:MAG: hypothetical protein ACKN9D_17730 [Actinomycetales bacterium]
MTDQPSPVVAFEPFLGRLARVGSPAEMAQGTYRVINEAIGTGAWTSAAELLEVTLLEAEELHEIYALWPKQVLQWLHSNDNHHPAAEELAAQITQLQAIIGGDPAEEFEPGWRHYVDLTQQAQDACAQQDPNAAAMAEQARAHWQGIHDRAVDWLYGLLDMVVRRHGEESLLPVWNLLMGDWYLAHERRLSLDNQPWQESVRQLRLAILDGFHAHLTGPQRLGDVELLEEQDRVGFRFAPCGSGGRAISRSANGDSSRAEPPYNFAVTTAEHDWAWNMTGICAYCVHCCLLNELEPIDRLGYPTRVIDPPRWPQDAENPTCTWWIYQDPSLVPEEIYRRVGRSKPALVEGGEGTADGD